MNSWTPSYCHVYLLQDFTQYEYTCQRYQCLNGHYYEMKNFVQVGCNWGPSWGTPPSCPNNSCSPIPITGP